MASTRKVPSDKRGVVRRRRATERLQQLHHHFTPRTIQKTQAGNVLLGQALNELEDSRPLRQEGFREEVIAATPETKQYAGEIGAVPEQSLVVGEAVLAHARRNRI